MKKFNIVFGSLISSLLVLNLLFPKSLLANDDNPNNDNIPIIGGSGGVYTPPSNDDDPNNDNIPIIGGSGGVYTPPSNDDDPSDEDTLLKQPLENKQEIGEIVSPGLEQFVLPTGCDLAHELAEKLPSSVSGVIANSTWVTLPVTWDFNIDTQSPGLINITGSVDLGEYTTSLEDTNVYAPVLLYNDSSSSFDTITNIVYDNSLQILPIGGSIDSLSYLSRSFTCYSKNNQKYICTIDWDTSTLDTSRLGMQELLGTPHLPSCLTIDDQYQTITQPIYIVPVDKVILDAATFDGFNIICKWYYRLTNPDLATFYCSKDGISWVKLSSDDYSLFENELHFSTFYTDINEYPYFYLAYENKKTDILHITSGSSNGFLKFNTINNSRDGSKYEGQSLPKYDNDSNSSVTDQSTTLTGDHLDTLTTINPESVFFEKQGVVVSISSPFLNALNLSKKDLLTVILDKKGNEGFTFDLLVNDIQVKDLPDIEVQFPVKTDTPNELAIVHQNTDKGNINTDANITKTEEDITNPLESTTNIENDLITPTDYNDDFGTATFTINEPGTYTLSRQDENTDDSNSVGTSVPTLNNNSPKTPSNGYSDSLPTQEQKNGKVYIGILAMFTILTSLLGLSLKNRRGVHHE